MASTHAAPDSVDQTGSSRTGSSRTGAARGWRLRAAAVAALGMIVATTSGAFVPSRAAGCIGSGTQAPIQAALVGNGAQAVLCANAVVTVTSPISFTAPNQQISTEGLPSGSTRAILRDAGTSNGMVINGNGQSGVVVRNIQVDGNRPALGRLASGEALLEMGHAGDGQTIRDSFLHDPRGWSALHLHEGTVTNDVPECSDATVENNTIGPSGTDASGTWADGISLACANSLVDGNTITDATDGGIVVFGAPGSTIQNNTVTAVSRQLLGGINMVDFNPVNGNYTGTVVRNNVVDGKSAFIKVGVAMGPQVWACWTGTNRGGSVTGNTVKGLNVGYGFAVNGVTNWTVTGNVDQARHVGVPAAGCGGMPSAPGTFQVDSATSSTLQPEFVPAQLDYVLAVSEPGILRVATHPADCGIMKAQEGLYPGDSLSSCDGRFKLTLQRDGNVVLTQGSTPLWGSGSNGPNRAVILMQNDGNLVLYDGTAAAVWDSATAGHAGAYLAVQNDGNVVIYGASGSTLWSTNTGGH